MKKLLALFMTVSLVVSLFSVPTAAADISQVTIEVDNINLASSQFEIDALFVFNGSEYEEFEGEIHEIDGDAVIVVEATVAGQAMLIIEDVALTSQGAPYPITISANTNEYGELLFDDAAGRNLKAVKIATPIEGKNTSVRAYYDMAAIGQRNDDNRQSILVKRSEYEDIRMYWTTSSPALEYNEARLAHFAGTTDLATNDTYIINTDDHYELNLDPPNNDFPHKDDGLHVAEAEFITSFSTPLNQNNHILVLMQTNDGSETTVPYIAYLKDMDGNIIKEAPFVGAWGYDEYRINWSDVPSGDYKLTMKTTYDGNDLYVSTREDVVTVVNDSVRITLDGSEVGEVREFAVHTKELIDADRNEYEYYEYNGQLVDDTYTISCTFLIDDNVYMGAKEVVADSNPITSINFTANDFRGLDVSDDEDEGLWAVELDYGGYGGFAFTGDLGNPMIRIPNQPIHWGSVWLTEPKGMMIFRLGENMNTGDVWFTPQDRNLSLDINDNGYNKDDGFHTANLRSFGDFFTITNDHGTPLNGFKNSDWQNVPFIVEVIDYQDNVVLNVETFDLYEVFDNYDDCDFSTLPDGDYTIKVGVDLDGDVYEYTSSVVTLVYNADEIGFEENIEGINGLTFDAENGVFTFTTGHEDYSDIDRIFLHLMGPQVNGFYEDPFEGGLGGKESILLYKDGNRDTPIELDYAELRVRGTDNDDWSKFWYILDKENFNFEQNATYVLEVIEEESKNLLKLIDTYTLNRPYNANFGISFERFISDQNTSWEYGYNVTRITDTPNDENNPIEPFAIPDFTVEISGDTYVEYALGDSLRKQDVETLDINFFGQKEDVDFDSIGTTNIYAVKNDDSKVLLVEDATIHDLTATVGYEHRQYKLTGLTSIDDPATIDVTETLTLADFKSIRFEADYPMVNFVEGMVYNNAAESRNNVIGYDSNDEIAIFALVDGNQFVRKLIVDPKIEFANHYDEDDTLDRVIDDGNIVYLVDRYRELDEHNRNRNGYNMTLSNTGLTESDIYRYVITGKTEVMVEDNVIKTQPFILSTNEPRYNGNIDYNIFLVDNFVDGEYLNYCYTNGAPNNLAVMNSQEQIDMMNDPNFDGRFSAVPFMPGYVNKVTLEIEIDGNHQVKEFYVLPLGAGDNENADDNSYEIMGHIREVSRYIGPNTSSIPVEFAWTNGNLEKFELSLLDNNDVEIARYETPVVGETYLLSGTNDDGSTWSEWINRVDFELGTGYTNYNNIDQDDIMLAEFEYEDTVVTPIIVDYNNGLPIYKTIHVNFTEYFNNEVRYDALGIDELGLEYFGQTEKASETLDVFEIHYYDNDIFAEDADEASIHFYDKEGQSLDAQMDIVEIMANTHNNDELMASKVLIFIKNNTSLPYSDIMIEVGNVLDVAGNPMSMPIKQDMRAETEVMYTVLFEDDSSLNEGFIRVYDENETNDYYNYLLSLDPSTTDYNTRWPEDRSLKLEVGGYANFRGEAGNYQGLHYYIIEGNQDELQESIPVSLSVPITRYEDKMNDIHRYEMELQIPNDNLVGQLNREHSFGYSEYVILIEEDVYQDFEELTNKNKQNNEWDRYQYIYRRYSRIYKTDDNGKFSGYIDNGNYKLVGTITAPNEINQIEFLDTPLDVVVNGSGLIDLGTIDYETANTTISIKDEGGNLLPYAEFKLVGQNAYHLQTDKDGRWIGRLPEDDYTLSYVHSYHHHTPSNFFYQFENHIAYDTITISDGVFNNKVLTMPETNYSLEITATDNKVLVNGINGCVELENIATNYHLNMGTNSGYYNLYIPEGTYDIKRLRVDEYEAHDNGVDIDLGTVMFSDAQPTDNVDVTSVIDVMFDVHDGDGVPVSGIYLELFNAEKDNHYGVEIGANGKGYMAFNDNFEGDAITFKIKGYVRDSHFVELDTNTLFTINKGSTELEIVDIEVIPPNFRGVVLDEQDEILIKNAWLRIEHIESRRGYGAEIGWTGEFAVELDKEGTYLISEIDKNDTYYPINTMVKVAKINGEMVVLDMNDQPITMPMILRQQQPNLAGTVYKTEGVLFETEGDRLHILIRESGVDPDAYNTRPWLYEQWTDVDIATGDFGMMVDDNKSYEAVAVSGEGFYKEFSSPVILVLDQNNIVIPPAAMFSGEAFDYYDNGLINGHIGLKTYLDQWEHARIESDNSFGENVDLSLGFIINDIRYWDNDSETSIAAHVPILYTGTKVLMDVKPNVQLVIDMGAGMKEALANREDIYVSIRPIYENASEMLNASQETYDNYLKEPWRYNFGEHFKADENGVIEAFLFLDQGEYEIESIHFGTQHLDVNKVFTLGGISTTGKNPEITYNAGKYAITYTYTPNVNGVIQGVTDNSGNIVIAPASEVWVQFLHLDDDGNEDKSDNERWFGVRTDTNGYYSLELEDGNYVLEGYHTDGYWDNGVWQDGTHTNVQRRFKIASGTISDMDGNTINMDITPSLVGYVSMLNNTKTGYEPMDDAWVELVKLVDGKPDWEQRFHANTGYTNNLVSLSLEPGNYRIQCIGNKNAWYELQMDIVVDENVNEEIFRPKLPNFVGIAYIDSAKTEIAAWGNIYMSKVDGTGDYHVSIDAEGRFEATVPDGEWLVHEVNAGYDWTRLDLPMTVNTSVVVNPFDMDGNDIVVAPPTPNVTGQVYTDTGILYNGRAWITIKPAEDASSDWSNAIWVDTIKQSDDSWVFGALLENGTYEIAEVGSNQFYYRPNTQFTVNNNTVTVDAKMPTLNITGQVYRDKAGNTDLGYGTVTLIRTDVNGNQLTMNGNPLPNDAVMDPTTGVCFKQATQVSIESDSSYQLHLGVGYYRVVRVSGFGITYNTVLPFEVTDPEIIQYIHVTQPSPNLVVNVTDIPIQIQSEQIWLFVEDSEGNAITMTKVSNTGGTASFEAYVLPGDYTITKFVTIESEVAFKTENHVTVAQGQVANKAMVIGSSAYKTLTGTLMVDGHQISERTWLTISHNGELKKVLTDEQGIFSFVLLNSDTDWEVVSVADSTGYKSVVPGTYINPHTFVNDGDLSVALQP